MLKLYTSKLSRVSLDSEFGQPEFIMDFTPNTHNWSRTMKKQGGMWEAKFTLTSASKFDEDGDAPEAVSAELIQELFYHGLGLHVEEELPDGGGVIWEGWVSTLILQMGNLERQRSYENLYNRLIAFDRSGNIIAEAVDIDSILRYGLIEKKIQTKDITGFSAQQQLDSALQGYAWPNSTVTQTIDIVDEDNDGINDLKLEVRVSGYITTASWRYVSFDISDKYEPITCEEYISYVTNNCGTDAFNPNIFLSTSAPYKWVIEYLVNEYCDYLTIGTIKDNGFYKHEKIEGYPLSIMIGMANDGGGMIDGVRQNLWRLWCDVGGVINYNHINTTLPAYFIDERGEWLDTNMNRVSHRTLTPAVAEDISYPVVASQVGAAFPRQTMFYLESVTMKMDPDGDTDATVSISSLTEMGL